MPATPIQLLKSGSGTGKKQTNQKFVPNEKSGQSFDDIVSLRWTFAGLVWIRFCQGLLVQPVILELIAFVLDSYKLGLVIGKTQLTNH